jgi:hypothetical protein
MTEPDKDLRSSSGASPIPAGGTPTRPPAFNHDKKGGSGDTSPERVRARGPFAQRPRYLICHFLRWRN